LEHRLALILFYFGEEPTSIDRIAELWGMLEFALSFEGRYNKKLINM